MPTKISIMLLQLGSSENTLSTNILLIANKTQKIQQNKTKQNKQTSKNMYTVAYQRPGKWREEPGTKKANNLIKLIRRISVRSVLEI